MRIKERKDKEGDLGGTSKLRLQHHQYHQKKSQWDTSKYTKECHQQWLEWVILVTKKK
jgi:hypothetical protein